MRKFRQFFRTTFAFSHPKRRGYEFSNRCKMLFWQNSCKRSVKNRLLAYTKGKNQQLVNFYLILRIPALMFTALDNEYILSGYYLLWSIQTVKPHHTHSSPTVMWVYCGWTVGKLWVNPEWSTAESRIRLEKCQFGWVENPDALWSKIRLRLTTKRFDKQVVSWSIKTGNASSERSSFPLQPLF